MFVTEGFGRSFGVSVIGGSFSRASRLQSSTTDWWLLGSLRCARSPPARRSKYIQNVIRIYGSTDDSAGVG